ncbi:MAG TPA: hypothetical protein VFT22_43115 [Kofleriaceae bacterium]|nr:hypothetical protein [Kofleriaceae bacterium]
MQDFFEEEHTEILARVAWARKRPSMMWLVGAGLSLTVAVAITLFQTRPFEREVTLELERDAVDIGRAIDAAAEAAHQRASIIAHMPILRAAILTDAATVADVMKNELDLRLAPGERVELLQVHDGKLDTLLRLPASASLPSIKDRGTTILELDERGAHVIVGAHVARLKDGQGYDANTAGMFVLSAPVDLAAIRRRLSEHAISAALADLDRSVWLVHQPPGPGGELMRLTVPSRTAQLTLTVAPETALHHARWLASARRAMFGLFALTLLAFLVMCVVRRSPHRR